MILDKHVKKLTPSLKSSLLGLNSFVIHLFQQNKVERLPGALKLITHLNKYEVPIAIFTSSSKELYNNIKIRDNIDFLNCLICWVTDNDLQGIISDAINNIDDVLSSLELNQCTCRLGFGCVSATRDTGVSYLFNRESANNFNVQNFISNLTKLNSLSLNLNDTSNNKINQEFSSNIANNLQELIIDFSNNFVEITTFEKICTIIREQNKLKRFKITNCYSLLNNILLSLEIQKNSLVNIEFINTNFSNANLKSFNNLYNLKYLRFVTCKGILLDQCEILNFVPFKLKELSFASNNWDADVTSLMIKYLGASLQRLLIGNPTILSIENISIYCSNIIFLKILIDTQFNCSVLPFFRNLRRILNFSIITSLTYNTELFINLSKNIPINISKISISYYNSNKYLKFKDFLENCHNKFEIINLNHTVELNFLKIVLNYIERSNNSLKILGLINVNERLNDEESMLLNSIKAKGIKIMEFHNLNDVCEGLEA
ncbi:unnamed protein product [Rhizophagus irregularis]|nr:unnamed protein product [Rhizophagus irregularis]